jgi:hypothetical protein
MATNAAKTKAEMAASFQSLSDLYYVPDLIDPYPLYAKLRRETPVMDGDILARFELPSEPV